MFLTSGTTQGHAMARQLIHNGAVRYYRHDDECRRDLIERWQASGVGVRKFCEQNGVATAASLTVLLHAVIASHNDVKTQALNHMQHMLEQFILATAHALDVCRRQAGLTSPTAGTWTTIRTVLPGGI
jgi:DNA-binding transcriptional MerR regulator